VVFDIIDQGVWAADKVTFSSSALQGKGSLNFKGRLKLCSCVTSGSSSALEHQAEFAMKRIFSSPNLIEVTQLKDTLENAGIPSFIRNEISSSLAPEIPMTENTPEVWIRDDHSLAEAMQVKSDWRATANVTGRNWLCPACGETSEPQFTSCWKCGALNA